ncbi:MAG: mechanosensitive ion channel [Rhodothalassiaceae bacterium]
MDMQVEALKHLRGLYEEVIAWLGSDLFAYATLGQIALLILTGLAAVLLGRALLRMLDRLREDMPAYERMRVYIAPLIAPLLALLLIGMLNLAAGELALPHYLFGVALSLLTAWLVIRLAVNLIASRALQRLVATIAWLIAAFNILGLLDPILRTLDAARLNIGEVSISALAILNGAFVFFFLIWLALFFSRLLEGRIDRLSDVNPSARELVKKLARIMLVIFAFLIALNATGISLTALAVFSGALGVGIGFGLQKVVANFISGVILLMDRSIKPGDVIETQGTYGWINHLGARYTSIITRDGTEFLIPNEDMITQPVINWSFSDRRVRRKIPVSVAYESDIRKAMALMEEAARSVPRVLRNPPPVSRLMGFGDNGVDLELRLWIEDPQSGVVNVASDVMLAIWDLFHEHDIIFPFPHRVIEFKGKPPEISGNE